jgi:hypothetical protein
MRLRLFHNGHYNDSKLLPLDDNTLSLNLLMRVFLQRIEPTSHSQGIWGGSGFTINKNGLFRDYWNPKGVNLVPWNHPLSTDGVNEWENWRQKFRRVIERAWSDTFFLVPDRKWYKSSNTGGSPALRPVGIQCSLSIQLVNSKAEKPHLTIQCIHSPDAYRSSASPDGGTLVHRDLDLQDQTSGSVHYYQRTAVHEFGHVLNLQHVRHRLKGCILGEDACYGNDIATREDVMGMGGHFTDKHAKPWLDALRHHLITENAYDKKVKFNGSVSRPQLIEYWDDNWFAQTN